MSPSARRCRSIRAADRAATSRSRGLPREKVLATVVQLLEKTLIRVGNEEYARAERLVRPDDDARPHVDVEWLDRALRVPRQERQSARDRPHATAARAHRQALPRPARATSCSSTSTRTASGRSIDSADVNAYLREITGEDFTAKDFRTWAGTVLAARALRELPSETATEAKKNLVQAIEAVAGLLGNTKSVCRKCYIHPAIIDSYLDRSLLDTLEQRADAAIAESDDLKPDELAVLKFLRKRLEKDKAA